jgi:hypothetical protein
MAILQSWAFVDYCVAWWNRNRPEEQISLDSPKSVKILTVLKMAAEFDKTASEETLTSGVKAVIDEQRKWTI